MPPATTIPTSVINEVRTHIDSVYDVPYTYDVATIYRTTDVLPDLDDEVRGDDGPEELPPGTGRARAPRSWAPRGNGGRK